MPQSFLAVQALLLFLSKEQCFLLIFHIYDDFISLECFLMSLSSLPTPLSLSLSLSLLLDVSPSGEHTSIKTVSVPYEYGDLFV